MSIIEQASRRLQELARTGVEMPWGDGREAVGPGGDVGVARADLAPPTVSKTNAAERNLHHLHSQAKKACSRTIVLDLERLEGLGFAVTAGSRSTLAEEFRHIKLPLLGNVRQAGAGTRMSLIMVTSALPGEGKTFCAINLAMSMALEVDRRVLLVDADVVRGNVVRTLGIQADRGLLDVLVHPDLDLSQVLLRTNIPNLSILPAGTPSGRSTELLSSHAMEALLDELESRYPDRIVVFDSTPLLLTAEAKVMASRMGQVVVVVEASKTPLRAVEEAFEDLQECPIVMSVLNKGREPTPDYGSYYR